ncbi:MAG TPA: hypothetical protein VKU00_33970 [Chthonomonadaceae bacterium]|nr:hypothetical protein [Chthonomonadaceae bacterium]
MPELPNIHLGSLEVSRLIVGGNPISGFSHQSSERSRQMLEFFTVERIKALWHTCEAHGITALVARADAFVMRVLAEYWREGGRLRWIAQTAPEHRDPFANIRQAAGAGASAIYVHGGDVGRLMEEGNTEELRARVECIRSLNLPVGMAAHDPQYHLTAQSQGLLVDFHMVCLYNLTGYRGRRDLEPEEQFLPEDRITAMQALRRLDQPCIAYKILGAGRLTLQEGLSDVAQALRTKDGILMGMFPPDRPDMVAENVAAVAHL